jgi:hypothetical protein
VRRSAALLAVLAAASAAVQAQDAAPAPVEQAALRHLVREPLGRTPDRRALLDAVRAAVRAGDARAFEAAVRALEAAGSAARAALRSAVELRGGRIVREWPLFGGALAVLPAAAVAGLRLDPAVDEVEAERLHAAHIDRSTDGRNHGADQAHAAWPLRRGEGATLALLDSGLDLRCAATGTPHPAFLRAPPQDGSRIAAAFGFAATTDLEDLIGHGTAVAGIALGRDWANGPIGDDGFAPLARVASFKITAQAGDRYADGDLIAALDAVARERLRLGLSVLNLSWAGVPSSSYVTQRTLDELAYAFDVLVVVSAGNDGDLPNPTARSHGATNVLAVAAVHPDSHAVWERSTYGPLLGDPERSWPDLAAVGVGLRTPAIDQPTGLSAPWDGTSFAAPAVSGTALMLRGAAPELSSIETRAILLASTLDLAAANPGLGPSYFGCGLLRTDLAMDALARATRFSGSATAAVPDAELSIEVAAGQDLVAVLAWDRTDVFSPIRDDLDLEVLAPDGRVVAVGAAPRNLYERVRFVADRGGSYRLRVLGRTLTAPPLTWALVVAENRGGTRQPGSFATFGAPCPGEGLAVPPSVVVPDFTVGRFGTAKSALPLASAPGRFLQIVDRASLPPDHTIRALGLRRDETSLGAPGWRVDLEVRIGHAANAPSTPSPIFDRNFAEPGDLAPLLDAPALDLPGIAGLPGSADQFDLVLPLDRPFVPDGRRDLVIDFRLRGHSRGSAPFGLFLDAELDLRTASVSAIGDPDAAVGIADPVGLVLALLDGTTAPAAPRIGVDRDPRLGEALRLVLREARPGAVAALAQGLTDAPFAGHPLPLGLDPFGAPGCALLVRPDLLFSAAVGANGQAQIELAIPTDPLWVGTVFFGQFLVLDPAANALGLSATAGAALRIGR